MRTASITKTISRNLLYETTCAKIDNELHMCNTDFHRPFKVETEAIENEGITVTLTEQNLF